MALVSGQALCSMAELNTATTQVPAAEDSDDDEYVYVSSLAEQIAHALMLDDEEEPPALQLSSQPSSARSHQQELWSRKDNPWPVARRREGNELESKIAELTAPVSHFAAVLQHHGPTEWDCFYIPCSQQASQQLSQLCTSPVEWSFSKHHHLFRGWNSSQLVSSKHAAAPGVQDMWSRCHQEIRSMVYDTVPPIRKGSVGTGVFLPNVVNSSLHYRRKAGLLSSKSAHGPRHRC